MTVANITIKLKDCEFELNRDEAVELHKILGVLLGLKDIDEEYLRKLGELLEEVKIGKHQQPPMTIVAKSDTNL